MAHADTLNPPSRLLFALELRALPELGGFVASLPLLTALAPRGDGHPVLVLPGLVTSDRSTVALRGFLKSKGYASYGWDLGRNYGPLPGVESKMIDRLKELAHKHERKVSLVGWSLGGIYARQLAKMLPDDVRRMALPVLSHRLVLSPEARMRNMTAERVLDGVIGTVQVPVKLK